jgi:hypothetical protein
LHRPNLVSHSETKTKTVFCRNPGRLNPRDDLQNETFQSFPFVGFHLRADLQNETFQSFPLERGFAFPHPTPLALTNDQVFQREKNSFMRLKGVLLGNPSYDNKYVAIVGGRIVDSDSDKSALVERVYKRDGYVPMYIGKVTREENRYRHLPSPRRL